MTDLGQRYLDAKRALFRAYYGATLNDQQTKAVCTAKGPLLVLAGAGSGKTTVLVRRIAHLIKYGIAYESDTVPENVTEQLVKELEESVNYSPEEIEYILPEFIEDPCPPYRMLAITFTNKAAREIKERLKTAFEEKEIADDIVSGTFHSVCLRILHRYGERVGLASGFTIYDTDDKKKLLVACQKELDIDEKFLPVKTIANRISQMKDRLFTPEEYAKSAADLRDQHLSRVYTLYQKRLAENNAVDFDDIIMKTVQLLEEDSEAREYYQKKFLYVSVDEYQDTNVAQFRLTSLLSGHYRNLMVVGDDDQSIYRFRGATVENILNFDNVYSDATVIKLEQNYRSTKTILAAANAIIAHNNGRHEKTLWSAGNEGEKIGFYTAETPDAEARFIIDKITSLRVFSRRAYRDFAVLYRVNEMSRSLESAFIKSGLPYRVLGGQRFYDRKEIRDMTAYLCLILNPNDSIRLRRIVNEPKRKIGDATLDAVEAIAAELGTSMFAVMEKADSCEPLKKTASRLLSFTRMIRGFAALAEEKPSEILTHVYRESGYEEMLLLGGEEMKDRINNIGEYVNAAVEYELKTAGAGETPTLRGFLEEVALVSDIDKYDENADAVTLMTVHSAKGLEFPIVFLPGMEENIFPSSQSRNEADGLEEERRLAYVAVTRAKERLYISHAMMRFLYGSTTVNPLSRFVAREIPESLLEKEENVRPDRPSVTYYSPQRTVHYSSDSDKYKAAISGSAIPQSNRSSMLPALIPVGTKVHHAMYGDGEIQSAQSVGGDIMYTVAFADGQQKRLMATYAKLQVIK